MGRPKSYRRDEAVARALPAFWKTGYGGTSLKALEAATGLNKFSLYDEFGSKRGVYLACLDLYVARYLTPFFEGFDPGASAEAPGHLLNAVIANLEMTAGLGCLLLNGGVEFQGKDPELNERIRRTYGILTGILERHWKDPDRAEAFTALVRGLMASGRLGLDRPTLERIVSGSRPLWAEPVAR